jgi:demethylmenaquinone methyltransferase/2-methoxy-6-polyprenyl-1,4-benzoquinol methylase
MPTLKETKVRQLFDAISPGYDRFNRISSLGQDQFWRKKSIQLGEIQGGMTILDIGIGTGDFSLCAGKVVGHQGRIYGMDISEGMLAKARVKIKIPFLPILARAEQIPLQKESVDRILMAFSLRNVTDVRQTLQECLQVLKRGGKIVVLEITRPANRWIEKGYRFYMENIIPIIGRFVCGIQSPFDYLNQSVMTFQTPHEVVGQMKQVGFSRTQVVSLSMGIVHVMIGEK